MSPCQARLDTDLGPNRRLAPPGHNCAYISILRMDHFWRCSSYADYDGAHLITWTAAGAPLVGLKKEDPSHVFLLCIFNAISLASHVFPEILLYIFCR